jgi:hypothetical protein
LFARPLSVILPVELAQLVGLVKLLPDITGVGFTTTVVLEVVEGHTIAGVVYVAVATTV